MKIEDGALEVSIFKYLNNVIEDFPEITRGRAATPAHDKLFEIRDDEEAKKLNKEQALAFHHTVAQLLFMAMRARQDIQTAGRRDMRRNAWIPRKHQHPITHQERKNVER